MRSRLETQVNTYVLGSQVDPQITTLSDGGWVIVWESYGQDGDAVGIFAQAYNPDGSARGVETQVNTYTNSIQADPQVTGLSDGGWVITWESYLQDGSGYGVYTQAFNADGTAQGVETQVNTSTLGFQRDAEIVSLANGGWVVTWGTTTNAGHKYWIFSQAYNADGTTLAGEVQVNTSADESRYSQKIAALSDGGWVITWTSRDQDGDSWGVYSQAYNADGTAQGVETLVNTTTAGEQDLSEIVALVDGGWVIIWRARDQGGESRGVSAQAYNSDGTERGGEIQVNTYTDASQQLAKITALVDGGWVVTWNSFKQDGSDNGIFAQAFNADGTKRGSERQVNTYTLDDQFEPEITALTTGGWVITWVSEDQDGSDDGIYMQLFNSFGMPLGDEVRVNEYTKRSQQDQKIAAIDNGGWVITWHSTQDDPGSEGIYSRTFQPIHAEDVGVTLSGDLKTGELLTVEVEGVSSDNTINLTYIWTLDGEIIDTTTNPTFLLLPEHVGKVVGVSVSIFDTLFEETVVQHAPETDPITLTIIDGSSGDDLIDSNFIDLDGESVTSGADFVSSGLGNDTAFGGKGRDTLIGSAGEDSLVGGKGADILKGGKGKDILFGGKSNDALYGKTDRDDLTGGTGDDSLYGGSGRDWLKGSKGDDWLKGGSGSDDFIFNSGDGNDTIEDYDATNSKEDIDLAAVLQITDFADLNTNHMRQIGNDVVIDDGDNLTITLLNVKFEDLNNADFIF
ncbi:hypothetical protein [Planktotalea sp.]|uniref:hypothetical protein n=1 Tax=Planktotalea sp. TaxID=2029877 RepID=UPI003D6AB5F6